MRTPVLVYMSHIAFEALLRQYGAEVIYENGLFLLRGIQIKTSVYLLPRVFKITYSDGSIEIHEA